MYAQKEAAAETAAQNKEAPPPDSVWSENEAAGLRSYSCPSCGAELICDETTAATSCPYCGNPTVIAGQFSGMQRPELVLPFVLDKNAAKAALKKYYRGKRFCPAPSRHKTTLRRSRACMSPSGCSMPTRPVRDIMKRPTPRPTATAITSSPRPSTMMSAARAPRSLWAYLWMARPRCPTATWTPLSRMTTAFQPSSTAYLPGYMADKYDEDADTCQARAHSRMQNSVSSELSASITGYSS